jgi:hypothetical protein
MMAKTTKPTPRPAKPTQQPKPKSPKPQKSNPTGIGPLTKREAELSLWAERKPKKRKKAS